MTGFRQSTSEFLGIHADRSNSVGPVLSIALKSPKIKSRKAEAFATTGGFISGTRIAQSSSQGVMNLALWISGRKSG